MEIPKPINSNDEFLMFKDDRIGSYTSYTVVKKDDSKKINIILTNPLLQSADIEPDDLIDHLFDKALDFLTVERDGNWSIELNTENSFYYPDIIIAKFNEYATNQ